MIRPSLTVVTGTSVLLASWHVSASPSLPRPTAAAARDVPLIGFVGIEEADPMITPIADAIAKPGLYRRDDELTYAANICGFVSGSIDAGVTCKAADRTCMPVSGWLRCCPITATATCGAEAIPTACIAYSDGGSTGCGDIEASTTCCSETARPFCESLVMNTSGIQARNVICAGRDRGTGWLPLLATATDDPRLSTTTSISSSNSDESQSATSTSSLGESTDDSGDSGSEGSEEASVIVSTGDAEDGTETEALAPSSNNDNEAPVGAIVGGVMGAVAAVAIGILAVWFIRRRQLHKGDTAGNVTSIAAIAAPHEPKGGAPTAQLRDPAARRPRGPSSVFLLPQSLPELPKSPPRGHGGRGGSRGGASGSTGGGSDRPLSPPAPPSERFYYGGLPKGMDDPWASMPPSRPPPTLPPDAHGGFGGWRRG